jgi:hypothetical protein
MRYEEPPNTFFQLALLLPFPLAAAQEPSLPA